MEFIGMITFGTLIYVCTIAIIKAINSLFGKKKD